MSWLSSSPGKGDWVVLTDVTPTGIVDHLGGTGAPRGTSGVVVSSGWSRSTVRLSSGGVADVPNKNLRITRRQGGVSAFEKRTSTRALIRLGARIALLLPILYYFAWHLWHYRTTDGFLIGLIDAALATALDTLALAFQQPVATAMYVAACWGVHKLATLK